MKSEKSAARGERRWGSALIGLGVALFAVVGLLAVDMIRDPGGYYDNWVPDDEIEGPEASYEWSAAGLDVDFTDTSEIGDAPIERWKWDFDDGGTSSEPNPTHRFAEPGEWVVTLDVVDDSGRSSKAEGSVEIEAAGERSGDGAIGLADMADKVVASLDRSSKGMLVVVLVIGSLVVLALIGGRLVRYGVRLLRPGPDKIKVNLRPKELELAVDERVEHGHADLDRGQPSPSTDDALDDRERHDLQVGV